ncbi:hypothetical protein GF351_01865 [Candidatus Woesearchaeota archaeon]|nr:hypothetical protein [Candidatus Woesearchaeota archaeon]
MLEKRIDMTYGMMCRYRIRFAAVICIFLLLAGCSAGKYNPGTASEQDSPTAEDDGGTEQHPEMSESQPKSDVQEDERFPDHDKLVMFHNNQGQMCLDQLEWLESMKIPQKPRV